jgi:hypothetical protein
MIQVVHPGSQIRILTFYPSPIPDPGVKKAPVPGSGSATLTGYIPALRCSLVTKFLRMFFSKIKQGNSFCLGSHVKSTYATFLYLHSAPKSTIVFISWTLSLYFNRFEVPDWMRSRIHIFCVCWLHWSTLHAEGSAPIHQDSHVEIECFTHSFPRSGP